MKAFSVLELMVVLAMVGVLTAVAVPNITTTVRRAEGARAVAQTGTVISRARDVARSRRTCVDVSHKRVAPAEGSFRFTTVALPCPDGTGVQTLEKVEETTLPVIVTDLKMRAGSEVVDVVHFDREGALTRPFAPIAIDAVVGDEPRSVFIYPIAGVVSDTAPGTAEAAPPPAPAPAPAPAPGPGPAPAPAPAPAPVGGGGGGGGGGGREMSLL